MMSGKYLFEPGDVLYSKLRPYLRKALVADFRGVCSADMYPIRVNQDLLDPTFAAWTLVSDEFTRYAIRESARARMPKLNRQQLFAWKFLLPELSVQRRIVRILRQLMGAARTARVATEAQLAAAEALPAALLRQVFNGPEARHWPMNCLREVASVSGGIQKSPVRIPTRFHRPFLTVRNVQRGYLSLDHIERFELTEAELAGHELRAGDILIVEGNGSSQHIGRNALFHGEISECVHQNHLIRVRPDDSILDSEFASRYLNSDAGQRQMAQKAMTTTGLYTLSVSKIQQLRIPVPPIAVQRRVTASLTQKLAPVEVLRQAVRDRIDAINALPAALLRQAFSGQL